MKRFLMTGLLVLGLGLGLSAQDTAKSWLADHGSVKIADLTIGDLTKLAELQSIRLQQAHYIGSAGFASFVLPGMGQFKTGDITGGALHLLGQLALVGGTLYGAYTLAPTDLVAWNLTHAQRHALLENYWLNDPQKVLPALGVLAGGMALSVLHSVWAARDARAEAAANIQDGKVTFEPVLLGGPGMGVGMGMGMRF